MSVIVYQWRFFLWLANRLFPQGLPFKNLNIENTPTNCKGFRHPGYFYTKRLMVLPERVNVSRLGEEKLQV